MTETDICNLALGYLGVSKTIASLDESSTEARACKRHYANDRDTVLADFAWPFATRFQDLALVEEDPTDEWSYSYRKPTGALVCRRIVSGYANEAADQRIPFRIASDDIGELIFTDEQDAQMEFTWKITSTARFSATFAKALARKLASSIAAAITGGDPYKLGERQLQLYMVEIGAASAAALNESQAAPDPDAESIRARS